MEVVADLHMRDLQVAAAGTCLDAPNKWNGVLHIYADRAS
jgi:hypothetical protein